MTNLQLGVYRHYKGNDYEIIGFGKHSETLEDMVIYKALYSDGGTWVRPLSMWSELVVVDGNEVKRFEYVEETTISERQHELSEALRSIDSTLKKCEKALVKLREGSSSHTLTQRRIDAFNIAISLITKEMESTQ